MSCLTLINGSIRKLPILLRILVIGAISTALTYVLVGVLTGIFGFVVRYSYSYFDRYLYRKGRQERRRTSAVCLWNRVRHRRIRGSLGYFRNHESHDGVRGDEGPHLRNFHGCRLDRRALRRYRETRWI